jgi:hypothetical protein
MMRIRAGIILIIVSWLPIAQTILYIAHSNGHLTSDSESQEVRLVVWGIQILIGFVGLWLVGEVAIKMAKESGWKKTPGNIWRLFLHGHNSSSDSPG